MSVSSMGRWLAKGLAIVSFCVAGPACMMAMDPAKSNPAPTTQPSFKPGDTIWIAAEQANLMVGNEVVAALPKGQEVIVVEVRHPWIGTYALVNDQKKSGWLRYEEFVPRGTPKPELAMAATAQAYTTYRPVSAEPPAAPAQYYSQPYYSQSYYSEPYVSSVDQAYMIGKYDRHEVDPNVHVWEPWRQR